MNADTVATVNPSLPPDPVAPPPAVVIDGSYRFGTYGAAIPVVNLLDAAGSSPVRRALRGLRTKEWQAFQAGDDDTFILGAVYTAKVSGLLQVLVVNKAAATIQRWQKLVPGWVPAVAHGLSGTRSHGHAGGFSVTFTNEFDDGVVRIDATHPGRGDLAPLELHGVGRWGANDAGHLVIVHPFADGRALYSHKTMMPFDASVRVGSDEIGLAEDRGFLIIDDHHGEYPRPQRYDWLTAVRRSPTGLIEGFNLTANQVRDREVFNENALWIANAVHRLPAITVERPNGPWGKWHARDRSGAVDVTFTPTVRNSLHLGPRRCLAEYYAPYGWFEGAIDTGSARLELDGFFGMGEQKLIRL